jgi:hypothetical protein
VKKPWLMTVTSSRGVVVAEMRHKLVVASKTAALIIVFMGPRL